MSRSTHSCVLSDAAPEVGRLPQIDALMGPITQSRLERLAGQFLEAVHAHAKAVELDIFRRLPRLFRDAGLTAIGGDLAYPLVNHEGRAALLGTLQAMRPVLADSRFVQDGHLDRLAVLCADRALLSAGGSTLGLWGRRRSG